MGVMLSPILRMICDETPKHPRYMAFHCPGCEAKHMIAVNKKPEHPVGASWGWNGDAVKPTFTPSILVWASRAEQRCHSFVTDGNIQFLDDCAHSLKGQTVALPAWRDDE
jgi:Family of unknown function (DUF6527)